MNAGSWMLLLRKKKKNLKIPESKPVEVGDLREWKVRDRGRLEVRPSGGTSAFHTPRLPLRRVLCPWILFPPNLQAPQAEVCWETARSGSEAGPTPN